MRKIRKHHFQLLELMVAAFILLICIAPTMRIFTSMYVEQQAIIRENQRDHLAHLVHAKITELLYQRQLHLSKDEKATPIILSDPELNKELQKYLYVCEATLVMIHSYKPKGEEHPKKYLAQLVIKFKDESHQGKNEARGKKIENRDSSETFYDYMIYIDAGARKSSAENQTSDDESDDDDEDEEEEDDDDDEQGEDFDPSGQKKKAASKSQAASTKVKKAT